ncbi:hypothetical protein JKP88DRAFT_225604 [Tribonema minus]|uniref:RecA-like C-terminal domain-containing protein n=1 Tax=Tribonema minus TaxID=303371 RepID=A0A836C9K8_9STRA|nr:hypothetical protein JKP88DRAFT_225604 [Tribonema minus]
MLYGAGVDRNGELIDLGVKCGAVRKSGAWFSLGDVADWRAGGAAHEAGALLGQGREKAKALLAEQPHLAAALKKVIHSRLAQGSVSLASGGVGLDAAGDELQVEGLEPEEEQLKETAV